MVCCRFNRTEETYQTYDANSDSWNDSRRWVYFFSIYVSTENPLASSLSCLYENPIKAGQLINCQDLESNQEYQIYLFDLSGRVLLEKSFVGESEIRLPLQIEDGVYFLNVMTDGELAMREKIVIMN